MQIKFKSTFAELQSLASSKASPVQFFFFFFPDFCRPGLSSNPRTVRVSKRPLFLSGYGIEIALESQDILFRNIYVRTYRGRCSTEHEGLLHCFKKF